MERAIMGELAKGGVRSARIDVSNLAFISSAGLRVLMKLRKRVDEVLVVEASPEVYSIFEMTGFTQFLDVRRAMRTLSVDGLEVIGEGVNGRVYRLDRERILKTYNPITNTPQKIARERQVARAAFVAGVPTALSFEMVRVGDGFGIVYEMVDAKTLGAVIAHDPDHLEEYAVRMADMLRKLHATEFEPGALPDARLNLHAWVDVAERSGYYADEVIAAARRLVDSIPPRNTFIHGDFHPGNIMVTDDGEFLLIDMGDASVGDPVIDLLGSFQIMRLVAEHPGGAQRYMGLTSEQSMRAWDTFVRAYYGTDDPTQIEAIERRLRFYVILRSMPGVTFSEVVPEDKRREFASAMSNVLLSAADNAGGA